MPTNLSELIISNTPTKNTHETFLSLSPSNHLNNNSLTISSCITVSPQVPHPYNPQLAKTTLPKLKKKGVSFWPVHHPARPIGHGGLNQREPLASQTAHHLTLCWVPPFAGKSCG